MARIISNKHVCGVGVSSRSDLRQLRRVSGVYAIVHRSTGKRYIGQSTRLGLRHQQHMQALRSGRHECAALQALWAGRERDFLFVLLSLTVEGDGLLEAERSAFACAGDLLLNTPAEMIPPVPSTPEITFWTAKITKAGRPNGFGKPGAWVRALRAVLDLSQERMARRLGVVTHTVLRWEHHRIDDMSWQAMLEVFGQPPDFKPCPDPWEGFIKERRAQGYEWGHPDVMRGPSSSQAANPSPAAP